VIPVVAGSSPVGHPSHPMAADEKFMREAIRLASQAVGKTHPNPAVGCVLVKSGRIIARGWHRRAGLPHAEIEALRALKNISAARGATAYVTLEPCSTHGRTPPCTKALIEAGIARVVTGAIDPNPKHRGRGLRLLQKAGLKTRGRVLAEECAALNPEFHHVMTTGLPWVIAKCGMSLDGRLTRPPGEGQWITSAAARRDAMELRARVDAILVGAGTVRADDPALTLRGVRGPQPWRIIWAPRGGVPRRARLLTDPWRDRTLVLREKSLGTALRSLVKRGIQTVLVEGGGHTLGCLFDGGLAREVVFYVAPLLSGGSVPAVGGRGVRKAGSAPQLCPVAYRRIGDDLRISGLVTPQGP
jgi:diaminohydroxyphosphoribosylaminopyrimidine deaminase/5-amino-6-(5-phosphoribosylamino)uracil reductase